MDKNLKNCSSYSDLFEDFFRADAGQESSNTAVNNNYQHFESIFNPFTGVNEQTQQQPQQQQIVQLCDFAHIPTDQSAMDFYLQQQTAAFYQNAAASSYPHASSTASVHKPGFVRNRTRKNVRQKSVASAVRASHMMNIQGNQILNVPVNPLNEYQMMYQQQAQMQQIPSQIYMQQHIQQLQQQQQIPFYQTAAQIPTYQQQQQPQAVLMAKSPVSQQPIPFQRNSFPASPSARSPNSNSSDYVKMKLQQKIRSRMVSKGQIPPNPTEEELRLCGIQMSQQQIVTPSQLPTPKSSPRQIPRASFNNNNNSFVAAPMMIPNQLQQDAIIQEDLMRYFDMNAAASTCFSNQKDPLTIGDHPSLTTKQSQNQQQDASNSAVNYDEFFSDFILY